MFHAQQVHGVLLTNELVIISYTSWLFVSNGPFSFFYRACVGLPPLNHMMLEHKIPALMAQRLATPLHTQNTSHSKVPESHLIANGNGLPHVNGVVVNGF